MKSADRVRGTWRFVFTTGIYPVPDLGLSIPSIVFQWSHISYRPIENPRSGLHQVRCKYLHLTALGDDHVHIRHVLAAVASLCGFHLLDHVHTLEDLTEDNVLVVEEGCGNCGDKELGSVGVWSSVLTLISTTSSTKQ